MLPHTQRRVNKIPAKSVFLFLLTWLYSLSGASASPWSRTPGEVLLISQARYFTTTSTDSESSRFERIESDLYLEFGLLRNFTIGAKAVYGSSWQSSPAIVETTSGLNEIGGFGQFEFTRSDKDVRSLRLSILAPASLQTGLRQGLQSDGVDVDIAALYGRNLTGGAVKSYLALNAGYRKRFGNAADQLRGQVTFGVEPGARWLFLAEAFTELSLRNETSAGTDYDVLKLQPSVVYRFGKRPDYRWAAQAGLTEEISGRNLDLGRAVFISLWSTF